MPDRRKHRGAHPEDAELFAPATWPRLQRATLELSWLLGRGYTQTAALKLVGDRHRLNTRQRSAVSRSGCSAASLETRQVRRRDPFVRGENETSSPPLEELWIDGFNVIVSVEVALGGGYLFRGQDECLRDIASVHGNYRLIEETQPALELIARTLNDAAERCHWLIDSPVSNSGRLAEQLRQLADSAGCDWVVEVVPNPDAGLAQSGATVASADSWVLEQAVAWCNLADAVIGQHIPDAKIVDLRTTAGGATDEQA